MRNMTNLEYMIANLTAIKEDSPLVDDGGSDEEAFVYYNIPCPYNAIDERAHCYGHTFDVSTREMCVACKYEWLEQEVDT